MRIKISVLIIFASLLPAIMHAQQENVELSNPVYEFLKEMNVKGIYEGYDDANPNLSRGEISNFLKNIDSLKAELSGTERALLDKYKIEFMREYQTPEKTFVLLDKTGSFGDKLSGLLSKRQKYIYKAGNNSSNLYINLIGNVYLTQLIKPYSDQSSEIIDGGLRAHGTIFNNLGYYFSFSKGAIAGTRYSAALTLPKLNQNFNFLEDKVSIPSYDYTNGYLRYHVTPIDDMDLAIQLGREQITLGYGYGSKLVLSGNIPDMDFLKINFKYGVFRYNFIHASTVGNFSYDYSQRYTKYFVANRMGLSFPGLFDFDFNETVIYTGRLDFAYINPLAFYYFAEKSLQDRDNKNLALEFQTHFLKNIQFEGNLFIDDIDKLINFFGNTNAHQKFGYQIGTFIYQPLQISNLSFILEYTKIRPYTYTHITPQETYSAYGVGLGHRIGPNSDEVYSALAYNINDWGRLNLEYQFIRKGNNIYDAAGNMIKNVGGDFNFAYVENIDNSDAPFLDGERVNTNAFHLSFRYQPIKNIYFTLKYIYELNYNKTKNSKSDHSFVFLWMNVDY